MLDVIRGIALLGILLVNMRSFHSPDFIVTYHGITPNYQGIENFLFIFFQIFIQMKFYPIFAFLFGLGFYLFIMKSKSTILFSKRMIFLFIIGLFHLIFLWYGDILHIYALTGLLLIFFHTLTSRQIVYWAVALLTFYHLLVGASVLIPVNTLADQQLINEKVSEYTSIYQEAPYMEWILFRIQNEVVPILYQLPLTIIPILGMFLLGLFAGKMNLYVHNKTNLIQLKIWWKRSMIISIPLIIANGLIMSPLITIESLENGLIQLLTSISGITLSIFYMISLFLLTEHQKIVKLFIPFSYVGKMALTNYLLQTIVSISFYRFFHLYDRISLVEGTVFSFILYIAQLIISYFWLYHFHHGPLEWLWRSFTYGKIAPFKKKSVHSIKNNS